MNDSSEFIFIVRNTDYVGRVGDQANGDIRYNIPWLVVSTSNRHAARMGILKSFEKQLKRHADTSLHEKQALACCNLRAACDRNDLIFDTDAERMLVPSNIVEGREHGLSLRALFQSFILACLFLIYAHKSWGFNIEDIS